MLQQSDPFTIAHCDTSCILLTCTIVKLFQKSTSEKTWMAVRNCFQLSVRF